MRPGETAELAEELLRPVPKSRPSSRRPRGHHHPATALLAVGLVMSVLVMGAAMAKLHGDLTRLQAQISADNQISCASFQHVHLRVHGRTVRCVAR